jgi:hypothetical protein
VGALELRFPEHTGGGKEAAAADRGEDGVVGLGEPVADRGRVAVVAGAGAEGPRGVEEHLAAKGDVGVGVGRGQAADRGGRHTPV